jgi:hypothetical protein
MAASNNLFLLLLQIQKNLLSCCDDLFLKVIIIRSSTLEKTSSFDSLICLSATGLGHGF